MAPFAGYDMPISYPSGSVEEHKLCRRSVGLFDIDHMGQVEVSGPGADAFVSGLVTAPVLDMADSDARYSLLLSEDGLVLDDLFIYRLPGKWWIVVNASNRHADVAWMKKHAPASGVKIDDLSDSVYMIAVQGPNACRLMDLASGGKVTPMTRFSSADLVLTLGGRSVKALVGRTGYTGEDGVELFFPAADAEAVWQGLLDLAAQHGIEAGPIGLGARDSLRFEAGMPLHGHEISPSINPVEAGFKWACDFSKDFVGKAAVEAVAASGPARKLVGLEVTGGVPREGYVVLGPDGAETGICVAGMFCPSVGKYAANAFVKPEHAKTGTLLRVLIRDKEKDAVVVKRPLYVPVYRRQA